MVTNIFKGDVEVLRPIAEQWLLIANGDKFGLSISTDRHLADLQKLVNSEDVLIVLSEEGKNIGYIGVTTFMNPLGFEKIASEHYWFVVPEKRGFGSLRLINAAKQWAKDNGCSHIIFTASCLASALHDRTCELYEKLDMQKFETSYICEVTL